MSRYTIAEILEAESWLETGFVGLYRELTGCENVDRSRGSNIAKTPRVEVSANVGPALNHVHIFEDRDTWIWDAWTGELEASVVTHRGKSEKPQNHSKLLGAIRFASQLSILNQHWAKYQQVIILTDIREGEPEVRQDEENNLDISTMKWKLVLNVNPEVWPPSI